MSFRVDVPIRVSVDRLVTLFRLGFDDAPIYSVKGNWCDAGLQVGLLTNWKNVLLTTWGLECFCRALQGRRSALG